MNADVMKLVEALAPELLSLGLHPHLVAHVVAVTVDGPYPRGELSFAEMAVLPFLRLSDRVPERLTTSWSAAALNRVRTICGDMALPRSLRSRLAEAAQAVTGIPIAAPEDQEAGVALLHRRLRAISPCLYRWPGRTKQLLRAALDDALPDSLFTELAQLTRAHISSVRRDAQPALAKAIVCRVMSVSDRTIHKYEQRLRRRGVRLCDPYRALLLATSPGPREVLAAAGCGLPRWLRHPVFDRPPRGNPTAYVRRWLGYRRPVPRGGDKRGATCPAVRVDVSG